jgi:triphosphoribosyl-dephospho-CoA synthetase
MYVSPQIIEFERNHHVCQWKSLAWDRYKNVALLYWLLKSLAWDRYKNAALLYWLLKSLAWDRYKNVALLYWLLKSLAWDRYKNVALLYWLLKSLPLKNISFFIKCVVSAIKGVLHMY